HDRDFIDRVATTTIAMEGEGRATVYAGGWSDYRAQAGRTFADTAREQARAPSARPAPPRPKAPETAPPKAPRLTFEEAHRLEKLPAKIERLEAEIAKLEQLLADPDLYTREPKKFAKATEMLEDRQARLAAAEEEWLTLEEKRERVAG
ncbi:MAG: ABC transporter ATP-binding protein, partial [Pseudomonadota bacterium]